jgi:hypothetical protein
MTQLVQSDISSMVKNQLKGKEEQKNLKEAERKVKQHQLEIENLKQKNADAKVNLNTSESSLRDMR